MIYALVRTHPGREEATKIAIQSANDSGVRCFIYNGEKVNDYSYNLYCNELKEQVKKDYFFFLDSDDTVIPGAIEKIKPYLTEDKALIVQMLRNGRPKPRDYPLVKRNEFIQRGKIGLPCMILHAKHKHLADVTATEDGDYQWIKAVTDKIGYEFVPIPLVDSGKRGRGK